MGEDEERQGGATPQHQGRDERVAEEHALHAHRVEVATLIAEQLGESDEEPKRQIYRVVKRLGADQALGFLQQALQVEAAGGIMLADRSRRRTPGGVFFSLVKEQAPAAIKRRIFKREPAQSSETRPLPRQKDSTTTSPPPLLTWSERRAALAELGEEKGQATTMKITLIGRPGKVVERGQCIITTMQATKIPALPKGLPVPPAPTTTYTVYISIKHWRRVAEAISDFEDSLILEGWPHLDSEAKSIAVFVTSATTRKLQAASREEQATKPHQATSEQ